MRKATAAIFSLLAVAAGLAVVAESAAATDDTTTTVPLKAAHQNTSHDDPDFKGTDCGGLNPADGAVWHFIANQLEANTPAGELTAYFGPSADTVTETEVRSAAKVLSSVQHFFVQSDEPVLIDAFAVFEGEQPDAKLVLSHVCPKPDEEPKPEPAAEVSEECAEQDGTTGVTVALANTGDAGVVFTVDGGADIAVGPNSDTEVFVPVAEDADYSIDVTADGVLLATLTGTRDCEESTPPTTPTDPTTPTTPDVTPTQPSVLPTVFATDVEGAQVTRSAPLARTGSNSNTLVSMGALLVALGTAFVAISRRSKTSRWSAASWR